MFQTTNQLPSGKCLRNYGKIHHFQWVNPLYMAMFNSYVSLPEGKGHFLGEHVQHCTTSTTWNMSEPIPGGPQGAKIWTILPLPYRIALVDIGIPISISYFMKSPINVTKPGRYQSLYIYIIIIHIYITIVSYNHIVYCPHGYYPLAII